MTQQLEERAGQIDSRHPVDRVPPLARLAALGLQHVLAMYAGAVAVPLVVGGALVQAGRLAPGDLAYLISADLFVAGIATLIQSIGFWRFGVRLPLMQGCTFAAVTPMIAIGSEFGVTAIYGAVIASGLFMIVLAPVFSKLLRFFPPVVTGTVILVIGLSLMPVAAGWVGGGSGSPTFGRPINLAFAAGTLVFILLVERFAPPAVARVSILLGLVVGTVVAVPFGLADFSGVRQEAWFGVSTPFHFGWPTFQVSAILSMLVVALVIMTETTGDMLAVGEIVDRPVRARQLADGLRADGLSTLLGGVFNTFPYTAFAQNVGLVSLSGVRSRYVATFAGGVLVVLGLVPKLGAVVEGVPQPVLGGAGLALFGMVAASGVRTLTRVRFTNANVLVVAISVAVGLLPTVSDGIYAKFPVAFQIIFDSGISAGALTAIVLNLVFNSAAMQRRHAGDDDLAAHDAVRSPAA
ncbi:NCS2 family nucleobase:cation symporter-2 [Friedmanniella endophytica]|uniref:NCS2 family nucleobase:cation symporter-2 n=1 Tax=Microlunatus kandeliicorticis TaxID=1759536 RepID=A0A7W3P6S5_9ACTN|nr:nucleobase:cation symporter-2 family protein [Microlunatus kandeliicorticis]MBA8795284.1 NCS2 family nucleobase:cation symporter-2 [Microlunatus kandeliicorticis]